MQTQQRALMVQIPYSVQLLQAVEAVEARDTMLQFQMAAQGLLQTAMAAEPVAVLTSVQEEPETAPDLAVASMRMAVLQDTEEAEVEQVVQEAMQPVALPESALPEQVVRVPLQQLLDHLFSTAVVAVVAAGLLMEAQVAQAEEEKAASQPRRQRQPYQAPQIRAVLVAAMETVLLWARAAVVDREL